MPWRASEELKKAVMVSFDDKQKAGTMREALSTKALGQACLETLSFASISRFGSSFTNFPRDFHGILGIAIHGPMPV